MQVQRQKVIDIWLDCSQAVTVFESLLDRCDGGDKVGLKNQSITVCAKGTPRKKKNGAESVVKETLKF